MGSYAWGCEGYRLPIYVEWIPKTKPLLPYEISGAVTPERIERLPQGFKFASLATLAPDAYKVKGADAEKRECIYCESRGKYL